jgi:hypothetical protein
VASLVWLFVAIILAATLGMNHPGIYSLFEAIGLTVLGIIAFRKVGRSSYATGLLIAVSLSLLLDIIVAAYFTIR